VTINVSQGVKREAVENTYGATVYPCEPTLQAREETAQKVIDNTNATFIHPFNNLGIVSLSSLERVI